MGIKLINKFIDPATLLSGGGPLSPGEIGIGPEAFYYRTQAKVQKLDASVIADLEEKVQELLAGGEVPIEVIEALQQDIHVLKAYFDGVEDDVEDLEHRLVDIESLSWRTLIVLAIRKFLIGDR